MNVLEAALSRDAESTANLNEVAQNSLEGLSPEQPNDLFAEFGWNEDEFLRKSTDFFARELDRQEEFSAERNAYAKENLYSISPTDHIKVGPNCYDFASKWQLDPLTGEKFTVRLAPGELAHGIDGKVSDKTADLLMFGSPEEQKNFFTLMIRDDARATGREFKEVDGNYQPEENEWVVAMATSDNLFDNPNSICDFHFWRKGEHGQWLHKPGMTDVKDTDSSGQKILDPATCNRGAYTHFLGYFALKEQ